MNKFLIALAVLFPYSLSGLALSFGNLVYPLLVKFRKVPPFLESLFFSLFALPPLCTYALLPPMEHKCGVKKAFLLNIIVQALTILLIGALYFIHFPLFFAIWGIFFQFLSGVGDAGITYQFRTLAKRLLPQHFNLINEMGFA